MASLLLDGLTDSSFVLDDDGRIWAWGWDGHSLVLQNVQVLFHPPAGLVETVLNRVADSGESLKIGRVKSEKCGIVRCLNDERVLEVDHVTPPDV